jgi:hypothetical protein
MNFRVQIKFNFNSVFRNLRKNDKYIFFILTSPIGGYIYLHASITLGIVICQTREESDSFSTRARSLKSERRIFLSCWIHFYTCCKFFSYMSRYFFLF